MRLSYDPADNVDFWDAIERIPGYPTGERMPIREMIYASGAVFRLPETLTRLGANQALPLRVVMDTTPMQREGADLKALILDILHRAGWQTRVVELAPDATGQAHTDMPHIEMVKAQLEPGAAILSVGSGVVTDVAKHAAFLYEQEGGPRPLFVVFQTANSVSAYTSNMAPTFIDGVKRTLPSRYPDALVCDLETLRDAPYAMTVAGVGDLLAAFISFPDWYLANRLGMDPGYSELPQRLMGPMEAIFLDEAQAIRGGELSGVATLAKLISLGGLAMSLAHATTPMSGYEHVISHVLDLINEQSGRPLAYHGTQVAMATTLAALSYREFLNGFDPRSVDLEACYPEAETMRRKVLEEYAQIDPSGKAGEECWADYQLKLAAWSERREELYAFLKNWPAERDMITRMTVPPTRVVQILREINSPLTFAELEPHFTEEQVRFAFLNAPLMRKRLTLGDLLLFTGWDRESLWQKIWRESQNPA